MLRKLPVSAITDLRGCAAFVMTEHQLGQRAGFRVKAFATAAEYEHHLPALALAWRNQPAAIH
jgi:hypothetical protein